MNIPQLIKKSADLVQKSFEHIEKLRDLSHKSKSECLEYLHSLNKDEFINIDFYIDTRPDPIPMTEFLKKNLLKKIGENNDANT
jgi:hypothetical protein